MNTRNLVYLVALLAAIVAPLSIAESQLKPTAKIEKQSYAMGVSIGGELIDNIEKYKAVGIEVNQHMILSGIKDVLNDNVQFSKENIAELMQALEQEARTNRSEIQSKLSKKLLRQAATFFAENAKRENVKVTDSGLQYEILAAGENKTPERNDRVTIHYHGTLIDGTVFDSTVESNNSASFRVNQVISGLEEGLQLMAVGSKFKFYIPSKLGYGERASGKIPANSPLIFEVELLAIK